MQELVAEAVVDREHADIRGVVLGHEPLETRLSRPACGGGLCQQREAAAPMRAQRRGHRVVADSPLRIDGEDRQRDGLIVLEHDEAALVRDIRVLELLSSPALEVHLRLRLVGRHVDLALRTDRVQLGGAVACLAERRQAMTRDRHLGDRGLLQVEARDPVAAGSPKAAVLQELRARRVSGHEALHAPRALSEQVGHRGLQQLRADPSPSVRTSDAEPDAALAGGRHRPLEPCLGVADDLAVLDRDPVAPQLAKRRQLDLVPETALGQHLMGVQAEREAHDRRDVPGLELSDHSSQMLWS